MSLELKRPGRLYLALDLAAATAAFFTAVLLRYGYLHPIPPFFGPRSYLFYALLVPALYLPVLLGCRVGRERLPSLRGLFQAVFVLAVLVTVLPFYFRGFAFSRVVVLLFCLLTMAYGLGWRFFLQLAVQAMPALVRERVLLAARADRLAALAEAVAAGGEGRYRVVALALEEDDGGIAGRQAERLGLSPQAAGPLERGLELALAAEADTLFLDPEGIRPARWLSLAERLAARGKAVRLLPSLEPERLLLRPGRLTAAGGLDLLVEPIGAPGALAKRALDVALSVLLLALSAPLMLAIAAAIRLASPGPVLYTQERVGKDGVSFRICKFRTMVPEAEKGTGPVWSPGEDDRRTIGPLGRMLRRTGMDELPQLWNVLRGEMSLVGPRPERPFFFDSYPELYRGRLAVCPGMTGLAQVNCRRTNQLEQKVAYDLYYIHHHSLALDLEILWRTSVMLVLQEWRALAGKAGESR